MGNAIRWALLCLLCIWHNAAWGYFGFPDVQPTSYASAGGQYRWYVDPSNPRGEGKATYTLYANGLRQLQLDQPFTLLQADVAEDGSLYGYAYTGGLSMVADGSRLLVARIGPDTAVRILADVRRTDSRFLHTAPNPYVVDQIFDSDNDRLLLRVVDYDLNRNEESWWHFGLRSGQRRANLEPHNSVVDDAVIRVLAASELPGTDLLLVQFLTSNDAVWGTRFALLDLSLAVQWSLDWPDDYSRGRNRSESAGIVQDFDRAGAIVAVGSDGHFTLWSAAANQRVSLQWADGQVHERSRVVGPLSDTAAATQVLPPLRQLRELGSIELTPVHELALNWGHLIDFDVDEHGRFGILHCVDCQRDQALMRVDVNGQVDSTLSLGGGSEQLRDSRVIWIADDRWLLTYSPDGKRAVTEWVDLANGTRTAVVGFDSPPIVALARAPDGGFVALTRLHEQFTISNSLRAYRADGQLRWEVGENYAGPAKLFSPEDIAVTNNGDVVVLENLSKRLKRYDRRGMHLRTTELTTAWGYEPNYPTALSTGSNGALIVQDFGGRHAVVQMDAEDRVTQSLNPEHPNGQRVRLVGRPQAGADGRLWINDSSALLGLTGSGKVEAIVGPRAEPERLGQIARIAVSRQGRIHAVDDRTGAVHVFAANGAAITLCRPEATDYDAELVYPKIGLADSGEIYVERRKNPSEVVHYDARCQRQGLRRLKGLNREFDHWLPQPGTDGHWVIAGSHIFLANALDRVQLTLQRSAADRWLDNLRLAATAPDGSLMVATETSAMFVHRRHLKPAFARFGADGKPLGVWPTPDGLDTYANLAYDGTRTAYLVTQDGKHEVWVGDSQGRPEFRVTLAEPARQVFLIDIEAETELWLYVGERRIQRFALWSPSLQQTAPQPH